MAEAPLMYRPILDGRFQNDSHTANNTPDEFGVHIGSPLTPNVNINMSKEGIF